MTPLKTKNGNICYYISIKSRQREWWFVCFMFVEVSFFLWITLLHTTSAIESSSLRAYKTLTLHSCLPSIIM